MDLLEIKKQIDEMTKKYKITHSNYNETRVDGEVKFVDLHIRYKVKNDKKVVDFCGK